MSALSSEAEAPSDHEAAKLELGDSMDVLLRSVLLELRRINFSLESQSQRIEKLSTANEDLGTKDSTTVPSSDLVRCGSFKPAFLISTHVRSTSLLQEALGRYRLNAVSTWSCYYGIHQLQGEGPETLEIARRNIEWTSVLGDCWKIPDDNRIGLCFRFTTEDPNTVLRVRNFLFNFHRRDSTITPKGENFNVWDWFDTGISAYWCPGREAPAIPSASTARTTHSIPVSDNTHSFSTLVAPWRRIINLQGLTTISLKDHPATVNDFTDDELCPFLSKTSKFVFQEPMDEVLWRAVKLHLRCLRVPEMEHASMESKGWILFHLTIYEILRPNKSSKTTELWPSGKLHSDCGAGIGLPRTIRESAITIVAVPSMELPGPKMRSIFWTMLCMRPQGFPHPCYFEDRDDLVKGRTHEMLDDMSDLIQESCLTVVSRWQEITDYFESLLTEKNGLLNPEYHDSLLTDDSGFTRSKKYFWAIEFLKEAESSIDDNISQLQRFVDLMTANPPTADLAQNTFVMRMKKHQSTLQKLQGLRRGFHKKREEAKALRDGLFSASAVMESRAATNLGQNIKLLTYVSIFFLPISVCTSFWSMSGSNFKLSTLAAVLPIVAILTYSIVLNLDTIIWFFLPMRKSDNSLRSASKVKGSSPVQRFVARQVRKMQESNKNKWNERGNAFHRSHMRGDRHRPSFWRILQFSMIGAVQGIWSALKQSAWFIPRYLSWRRHIGENNSNFIVPPALGHLGDVRVKINVDVDFEEA